MLDELIFKVRENSSRLKPDSIPELQYLFVRFFITLG